MPNPIINPNLALQNSYTVTGSRYLWLDLSIQVNNLGEAADWTLTCPEAASVLLRRGATDLALPTNANVADNATFPGYTVNSFGSAAAGNATINVTIEPPGPVNEIWRLLITSPAVSNYSIVRGSNATIERVVADPTLTVSPLTTVFEKGTIVLNGSASYTRVTSGAGGLAGLPTLRARWSQVAGEIAAAPPATIFSGAVSIASTAVNFTAPGLYRSSEQVTYRLTAFYDENNNNTADGSEPVNTADQNLTINPRKRNLQLVVDRSGSMLSTMPGSVPPISRWEFARRAAHVWADLWIGLRGDVNGEDQAGIMIFEANSCGYGSAGAPIEIALPAGGNLGGVGDLDTLALDLGEPGSCTPIGDALLAAMDKFVKLNGGPDDTYTLLLLTDGYENSGLTVVEDDSPVPPGATGRFATRRIEPARLGVSDRLTIYSCGLGTPGTVQESVLQDLPNQPSPANPADRGIYRLVQSNQLLSTFAEMLAHALDAQLVAPVGAPANPVNDANALYVPMTGEHRAVFVVQWESSNDELDVFYRPQGDSNWTQASGVGVGTPPTGVTYFRRTHHGLVMADLRELFGGAPPDTEWAVVHRPNGGASQAIVAHHFVALADLVVKADLIFDRAFYRTNQRMLISCNLTRAGEPISDARITVELARPGESLGTFLGQNGARYRPGEQGGSDPLAAKAAMLQQLARQQDLPYGQLPEITPAKIFVDGTNELWDDGAHRDGAKGDGVFANLYTALDKEGTYSWRFFVEGRTAKGGYFNRLLTRSVWVGIGVDPGATKVDLNFDVPGSGDRRGVQITVLPMDRRGELLGPFRAADVQMTAIGGEFVPFDGETVFVEDGVVYPQPDKGFLVSHYDGRYSRVLLLDPSTKIEVRIVIQGRRLDPIFV